MHETSYSLRSCMVVLWVKAWNYMYCKQRRGQDYLLQNYSFLNYLSSGGQEILIGQIIDVDIDDARCYII